MLWKIKLIFLSLVIAFFANSSDESFLFKNPVKELDYSFKFGAIKKVNYNLEELIINHVKLKKKPKFETFVNWYYSNFFSSINEIMLDNLKTSSNKLSPLFRYNVSGERPIDGYIKAIKYLEGKKVSTLKIDDLFKLHSILMSTESIPISDFKMLQVDGVIKRPSEAMDASQIGIIRSYLIAYFDNYKYDYKFERIIPGIIIDPSIRNYDDINKLINPKISFKNPNIVYYFNPKNNFNYKKCKSLKITPNEKKFKENDKLVSKKLCDTLRARLEENNFFNKDNIYFSLDQILFSNWIQRHFFEFFTDFKKRLKLLKSNAELILIAAEFYREFISIHPFQNGNGRIARLLLKKILNDYKLPGLILYPFGLDVTLKISDLVTIIEDSIALSFHFQKDLLALLNNNLPYSYSYINFLAPGFFNQFIKQENVIIAEFMSWMMLSSFDLKKLKQLDHPRKLIELFLQEREKNKNKFKDWYVTTGIGEFNLKTTINKIKELNDSEKSIFERFLKDDKFNDFEVFPLYHRDFIKTPKFKSLGYILFNNIKMFIQEEPYTPEDNTQKEFREEFIKLLNNPNYHFKHYFLYKMTRKYKDGKISADKLLDILNFLVLEDNRHNKDNQDILMYEYREYFFKNLYSRRSKILDARDFFLIQNYTLDFGTFIFLKDFMPPQKIKKQQIHYNDLNSVQIDSHRMVKTQKEKERKKLAWILKLNTISAIKKLSKYSKPAYSAVVINYNYIKGLKQGSMVCFPIFLSTSIKTNRAEFFRKRINVDYVFKIISSRGYKLSSYSKFNEQEIIFLPNTRFILRKIDNEKISDVNNKIRIVLESANLKDELNSAPCHNLVFGKLEVPTENYYSNIWESSN
jgi:hypothetical protein